ncbi:hypothetical protein, partial [Clostridioides difficile]|uniref:hypothetical protein n=1 Tax=Clostridioides difficile TaxID=1496 RepID=UPI001CA5A275
MFIAALFTIAKTWNQPTCPETDEWIKKMWYIYIYNGKLLIHKKDKTILFATTLMEVEGMTLSEIDRERQT